MTVYPLLQSHKDCCNISLSSVTLITRKYSVSWLCMFGYTGLLPGGSGWESGGMYVPFNKAALTVGVETLSFLCLSQMWCGLMQSCIFLSLPLSINYTISESTIIYTFRLLVAPNKTKPWQQVSWSVYPDFSNKKLDDLSGNRFLSWAKLSLGRAEDALPMKKNLPLSQSL